jgi:exopolysaccharide production protein ExoQ
MMFVLAGDVAILAYVGASLWIAQRNLALAWRTLLRSWPLLLLPALCMLSVLWSDAPDVSLKQGAELIATFVLGIVICRRIEGRELAAALLVSAFLICLLVLVYQRNELSGSLVGFMGSKNQVGFASQILVASSVAVIAESRNPRSLRLFAIVGIALGLLDLALARSAGAVVTSVAAFLTFAILLFFSRVSYGARAMIVVLGALLLIPLAVANRDVVQVAQTIQTQVLHKDATLTGRTELWTAAQSVIAESPVVGHGYRAFWLQGNLDAEGLWQQFGISARSGFNFHNQFLETWVDLGEVGLCFLVATLVYVGAGSLWRVMTNPTLSSAFMATILVTLYSRLPVESTLVGPWNLYTLLWIAVGVSAYARDDRPTDRAAALTSSWRSSRVRLRAGAAVRSEQVV